MKKLLPAFIILLQTTSCFSQTKEDYDHAVKKIGKYYNLKQVDSLLNMYSDKTPRSEKSIWTGKEIDELKIRNGKMTSYEYAGQENGITLYTVGYARSTYMMGLVLDKENKLSVFHFKMSSPYIDSLLQQNK